MDKQATSKNIISNNSGKSHSLWMDSLSPQFSPLENHLTAEVCVIGSGIVGLNCAYHLAKQGKSIVVIDQGSICGGQSARTTAHLTWVLDDRFFDLKKKMGLEKTLLAAESHASAIDSIEQITEAEGIDCDFKRLDGYLFLAPNDSQEILEKEFSVLQEMQKEVYKSCCPFASERQALKFPKQAEFHILKYLQGLLKAIIKYGGKVYSHTQAINIKEGDTCTVETNHQFIISAQSVIVATATPINNRFTIHTKQASYRTYAIAAAIPKGSVPNAIYWDTSDPYHYIRLQPHISDLNLDWLIVGGEDHKTGQDFADKYILLENWARAYFPMIQDIDYRWSGQIFEPMDSLSYIGKNPGDTNVYIATGDSGNGMTHGTIAGMLISDLILGKNNPWKALYDPSRITFSAAKEFFKENLNTLLQYKDWLTSGEIKMLEELQPDEGKILRKGLKKIAVYKDQYHKIHICSAVCPHLGGCVRWNDAEKSWDCPCHGSRFNAYGQAIIGPALFNLKDASSNFEFI